MAGTLWISAQSIIQTDNCIQEFHVSMPQLCRCWQAPTQEPKLQLWGDSANVIDMPPLSLISRQLLNPSVIKSTIKWISVMGSVSLWGCKKIYYAERLPYTCFSFLFVASLTVPERSVCSGGRVCPAFVPPYTQSPSWTVRNTIEERHHRWLHRQDFQRFPGL